MKIVLTSQTPESVSGSLGSPRARETVGDAVSQNRRVADDEFGWYLTFFLALVIFFHDLSATAVPSDACSISLKESGRTNSPFVPSYCVSCICFV